MDRGAEGMEKGLRKVERLGHPALTVCVAPKAVYCPTAGGGGPGGGSSLAGSYNL